MKKIAIINVVFDYSSTGALARQLYEYGKENGYDAYAFYGRVFERRTYADKKIIRIDGRIEVLVHKVLSLLTGYQGLFSNHATSKLIKTLEKEQISNAILLNLHGYYINEKRLLSYLKEHSIKTVYVTPDEYAGMGKCCYSKNCSNYKTECKECPNKQDYPKSLFFDRSEYFFNMKKKLYQEYDKLAIVGPESNLVKFRESALLKDKTMKRASWGIDLDLYKYEINEGIYDKYGIPKEKVVVLTVAKYSDDRKGVKEYFFELARRLENTNYHFINIGYDGKLKAEEIPNNITLIGYIQDQKELAYYYALADLYLLASKTDTMPISCLISFACETPVCCFYTSGLKYLAERDNPAVKYCDDFTVEALEKIIRTTGKKKNEIMKACRKLAVDEYSIEAFNRKVYEALEEL